MCKLILSFCLFIMCLFTIGCSGTPKTVHRWPDEEEQKAKKKEKEKERPYLIQVEEVYSGDTIRLADGRVVKYIGIQAPVEGSRFFNKARNANAWLLNRGGNKIYLQFDRQKVDYKGRHLAYVYTPYRKIFYCFINKELLEHGFGYNKNIPPNTTYSAHFRQLEKQARENQKGIWKQRN